ncbi:hypothetical protein, partial [Lactobacillus sp.]|uniref:hypothetical protein n=1 Tax=Lactobacillus sp. TaxID=1591 RepID=UPI003F0A17D5
REEAKRARKSLEFLGISPEGDLAEMRRLLLSRKLELGHQKIVELCRRDVARSKRMEKILLLASHGPAKPCCLELRAQGISAKEFVEWFEAVNAANDEKAMLAAHPDHYLIDTSPSGKQLVYERYGGSPFVSRAVIDFANNDDVLKKADPEYPWLIAGAAINDSGKAIGGALHQFKDIPGGMEGKLQINFPSMMPKKIVEGHKIHLAIEFGNWIEAAGRSLD